MALIKCSECGADVSEKAACCPKCGCPIEVSIKDKTEIKKKKSKKIIIIIIILAVIAIVAYWLISYLMLPNDYYNGMVWGRTYEQMEQSLVDEVVPTKSTDTLVTSTTSYEGKEGVLAYTTYKFVDDKYTSVSIMITLDDESEYTYDGLISDYIELFDKAYGKHEDKSIPGLVESYIWETKDSKIELYLLNGILMLEYSDANYVPSPYYKNLEWGLTLDELKTRLGDVVPNTTAEYISVNEENYDGKDGVNAMVYYDCTGDSFNSVTIFMDIKRNSSYTADDIIDSYVKELDEKYGDHTEHYQWDLDVTQIRLSLFDEGTVVLEYENSAMIE